jgi:hypothetical protein
MLVYKRSITTERETSTTLYLASPVKGLIRHGYLLREDLMSGLSEDNQAPDTLTLDETWQPGCPGVYLFFPNLPAGDKDQTGFVTSVSNLLKHPDRDQVRFAWFADPEKWNTGLSAPLEIRVSGSNDNVSNTQQIIFSADKYTLRITKNNRIYPDAENNGFIFESVDYANSFGAALRTEIKNKLKLVLGNEAHQGCFRYLLNMTGKDLDALNVSLDYFYSDQRCGTRKLGYSVFDVKNRNDFWPLEAVFDPLNLLNDGSLQDDHIPENFAQLRTGFTFSSSDSATASPPLATHFRTRYGKQIELTPATMEHNNVKPAMLTFNRVDTKKNALSMVLQGDFYLGVIESPTQTANNPQHFLCGLSGTETISFAAAGEQYSGDIIRFHPRKPAFSARFPAFDQTGPRTGSSNNLLDNQLTTSWISIRAVDTTVQTLGNYYFSQPQDTPLFRATDNETSANNEDRAEVVFDVFDAPSANLAHSDINTDCFPMVPIAAAPLTSRSKSKKSRRLEYETRIINPSRKLTIDQYTTKARPLLAQSPQDDPAPENLQLTTTPQGFLVAFDKTDASKKWQSLILANEQSSGLPPLELKLLPPYVQSAFQTNEQFLVMSNPDRETLDYLKHQFQDQINIAAWPFILDVTGKITHSNTSTRYRNILIFKFCKHSLVDRLKNPELWTQPQSFNKPAQLSNLSQWVLDYIDSSRLNRKQLLKTNNMSREQHDTSIIGQGYEEFLQKVDDPNWNGIMALQVTLDLAQLPEAIKSIVAGIDIRRFAAHHVAINSNQILSTKGQLDKDFKSSMFGLISYFDKDYQKLQSTPNKQDINLPQVSGDYDFKVLELQVLFRHSEISDFNCKIQLSANTLFNDPVIAESNQSTSATNKFSIILEGLYDKHDGQTAYSFQQLSENNLSLNSTAIGAVNIHSVQLSTVHEQVLEDDNKSGAGSREEGNITTRFALTGKMVMQELEEFDMLSYDSISFSSLYIDMTFDVTAPQRSKRFKFIPANILLDPGESKLRNDSLVAHFPITLQSLEHFSPDASSDDTSSRVNPSTLGFQKVEAPMNYNAVKDSWYALQFNLNLGTMGSLAAKAGFDATVLLSWSPGIKNKAAQIWVRTPFSGGGGKQFSIQGVLKLVTQSIRLEKNPDKPEYAMLFTNVKVSLLGLKLPPTGNTLLYLFGNPDEVSTGDASSTGNLGWFGAYKQNIKKPEESKKSKQLPGIT